MSYSISTRYQVADPSALIEKAPAIREKAIAAGAEGAALIQPIAAGPHVDVMLALTVWNSVDAVSKAWANFTLTLTSKH